MQIDDDLPFDNDLLENKHGWLGWYQNGTSKKLIRAHGTAWVDGVGPDPTFWIRKKDSVQISDLIDNLNGIINGL